MHGLGQNRSVGLAAAQAMGLGERYAVLAFDARGHGESGGLVGIDGPKEVADVKAVFGWLRDRPDVADRRIGGWGVSYGGGAAWNSLAAGVPWAALEISISWTDLLQALAPQGLAKTGVITGFVSALDPKRVDPEVLAIRDAAFKGDMCGRAAVRRGSLVDLGAERGPDAGLPDAGPPRLRVRASTRRSAPYAALAGPKQLWIGLHGHAPSSGVAADTPAMLAEGARWFDRFLRGDTARPLAKPVAIAPERWRGQPVRFAGLPKSSCRPALGINTIPAKASTISRALPDPAAAAASSRGGLRLADRRGARNRLRRLVADRRGTQRAHHSRQGDRHRRRRRADATRHAGRTGSP